MLRNPRAWLGFLISLLFLALLLRQVDAGQILQALTATNYLVLFPALPCYFLGVWFRTERWRHLLAPVAALPGPGLFRYVVIGYMANDTLPLRAGELVRAYLVGRRFTLPMAPLLSTIALERVTDGLVLVGLMALAAPFTVLAGWMGQLMLIMTVLFAGSISALILAAVAQRPVVRLAMALLRRAPGGLRGTGESLVVGVLQGLGVLRQPKRLGAVAGFALLSWLAEAGVFLLAGWAMGIQLPWTAYFIAMAAANLATSLPSSQAGIGPFEYFCALTLGAFGIEPGVAAAYALVIHAVLILPVTLAGCVYLWTEGISLGAAFRGAFGSRRTALAATEPVVD